jgi:rod shape-determining protein MreD
LTLAARRGGFVILSTLLAAMVLAIMPLPEWAVPFRPQWYTLVLIYWALALPERVGVGIAWLVGILVDVMTGTLLGQHALALSLITFVTIKTHQRVRLFPLWQQSVTVLLLLSLEKLLSLWVIGAVGQPAPPPSFWAPPLVGMLLWPWVFIILRDLRRRFAVS